jgi:hypothetical protein
VATDLFDAGVKKMNAGGCEVGPMIDRAACDEAREDFRRAFALYPEGLGALRNLARVETTLGLLASAARSWRELARRAPLDPKPARRLWGEFATKELERLEPRVPKLVIDVPAEERRGLQRLVVTLDGEPLSPAAWGVRLELDPGEHVLRATADARAPFTLTFTLAEAETRSVELALEPLAPATPLAQIPRPASSEGGTSFFARKTTPPILTIGAGAVTTAIGLAIGAVAIEKRKEACGELTCDPDGYRKGRALADTSTLVTGLGLAVTAGGVVWLLLASPRAHDGEEARAVTFMPYASAGSAGFGAWGRF